MNEIIIFGVGGVGSWTAEFIARQKLADKIILIDFDNVEEKNLRRQNFTHSSIDENKAESMQARISHITNRPEDVESINMKIVDEIDMIQFNKKSLAIGATDNVTTKKFIAEYFENCLLVNCDKDFVEIKNYLDENERNAWDLGGGYNSEQNMISNMHASIAIIDIILNGHYNRKKFSIKMKPETRLKEYIDNHR